MLSLFMFDNTTAIELFTQVLTMNKGWSVSQILLENVKNKRAKMLVFLSYETLRKEFRDILALFRDILALSHYKLRCC